MSVSPPHVHWLQKPIKQATLNSNRFQSFFAQKHRWWLLWWQFFQFTFFYFRSQQLYWSGGLRSQCFDIYLHKIKFSSVDDCLIKLETGLFMKEYRVSQKTLLKEKLITSLRSVFFGRYAWQLTNIWLKER